MKMHCESCGVFLDLPDPFAEGKTMRGAAENYCSGCTDADGNLLPKEQIHKWIAEWLKSWQPNVDQETALVRAELYMKAMPKWAEG